MLRPALLVVHLDIAAKVRDVGAVRLVEEAALDDVVLSDGEQLVLEGEVVSGLTLEGLEVPAEASLRGGPVSD